MVRRRRPKGNPQKGVELETIGSAGIFGRDVAMNAEEWVFTRRCFHNRKRSPTDSLLFVPSKPVFLGSLPGAPTADAGRSGVAILVGQLSKGGESFPWGDKPPQEMSEEMRMLRRRPYTAASIAGLVQQAERGPRLSVMLVRVERPVFAPAVILACVLFGREREVGGGRHDRDITQPRREAQSVSAARQSNHGSLLWNREPERFGS